MTPNSGVAMPLVVGGKIARGKPPNRPMAERWIASLPSARRYIEDQQAAFLRGVGDPPPVSYGASRLQRERDREALARLETPLVLASPGRVEAAGHGGTGDR